MKLLLLLAAPLLLSACATPASIEAMERDVAALQSPEMEAAIRAAQPGVPR